MTTNGSRLAIICAASALGLRTLWFGSGLGLGSNDRIEQLQKRFLGKWAKVSSSECDRLYPDQIEFRGATFLGSKGRSRSRCLILMHRERGGSPARSLDIGRVASSAVVVHLSTNCWTKNELRSHRRHQSHGTSGRLGSLFFPTAAFRGSPSSWLEPGKC